MHSVIVTYIHTEWTRREFEILSYGAAGFSSEVLRDSSDFDGMRTRYEWVEEEYVELSSYLSNFFRIGVSCGVPYTRSKLRCGSWVSSTFQPPSNFAHRMPSKSRRPVGWKIETKSARGLPIAQGGGSSIAQAWASHGAKEGTELESAQSVTEN